MRALCKLALVLGALPLLMAADVYRWVDADGVVNYTQRKPEGVDADRVRAATGERFSGELATPASAAPPTAPSAAAGGGALNPQQQAMLAALQAAEQVRREEVARILDANCQQSRSLLEQLSRSGRIRVRGDDGREQVMPEDERQQRIDEAQRGVAANCSGTASR